MVKLIPLALTLLGFANQAMPQTSVPASGTITGTVLDDSGQSVAGATMRLADAPVIAMDLDRASVATTDEKGKFVIAAVKWGTYTLQAMKPEDGYPDPFVMFYRVAAQATASLSQFQPSTDIIVPIGPKAGTFQITVKDATTGKPVDGAEVTLRRWRAPLYSVSMPANGRVIIPSGIGVDLEVHAEGYERWHYFDADNRTHTGPLEMKPGEQRNLDVRLRPLAEH